MTRTIRPEGVAVTGWLCAVTGGLSVIAGAIFALAGALVRALEQQGTDLFANAGAAMDPLSRELINHFEVVATALVILGLASLIIGIQFLRMRPLARPALELLAWAILAATFLLEVAALIAGSRRGGPAAGRNWVSSPITSLVLSLLQVLACVLVIRFLRTAAIRAAFRSGPGDPSR
jgi:hypothetical protein